jgi:RHS repeat-associated protein
MRGTRFGGKRLEVGSLRIDDGAGWVRGAGRARVARRAGLLTALFVVAVALVPGVASAESLCTDTWTGPSEGQWTTAADWSTGKVPTSTDVACIGAGKTVKVTEGANQTGVVRDEGTLAISGGSFEVSNATEASSTHSLTLEKATLTGAGTLAVSESLTWEPEGVMSGSGKTVLEKGASGVIIPHEARCEGARLAERTFVNEGTVTFSGSYSSGGSLAMSEGAKLENKGTFKDNSSAWNCSPWEGTIVQAAGSKIAPLIVNTGTFEKTEGTTTGQIVVPFENKGTVYGQSAALGFMSGSSVTLASGSALEGTIALDGGTVSGGSFHASSATVALSAGSLAITSGSTATIGTFSLEKATLTGAGTLAVSGSLTWEFEGVMSGSGRTVLEKGATGTMIPREAKCEAVLLTERTFVNEGTVTFSGNYGSGSSFAMSEGAKLENKGTFKDNSEAWYCSPFLDTIVVGAGSKVAPLIVNMGTFERTEAKDPEFETYTTVPFENWGTVVGQAGKFGVRDPILPEPATQYGGSENPSAPGEIHVTCGKPVSCATGNESETQADLSVGGRGVGLNLTRYYNSQAAAAGNTGIFGPGWSSSFSDHLVVEKTSKKATLVQGNGSTVVFAEGAGGSFTAPAWTQDTLSGTSEAGYTLTLANQIKYKFAGSNGRLESVTDRNGNATTLAYGLMGMGHLETITDPAARKITLAYNAEGLVESAKDPMGHVVKYAYEGGNLKSVTEPGEMSARWQFKYDGSHEITEMIDGRAGKTINEYNASHQVTSQKDPMERTLTFEYETFHTKITNKATGSVTDERFTSSDEPFSVTHGYGTASATTQSFTYNAAGLPLSITDGNEHTTKYGYDSASNRTSMIDANNNETKWTYNTTHDVETVTTPKGETTTIKRDSHGNAEMISRPAPGSTTQTTKYKYDSHGNVESVEDPLKRVWKYEYNNQGDRTSETDPEGDKRTWVYDEDSRETSTVSPRGNVTGGKPTEYTTKIERDSQGRPLTVTDPLGHATQYAYGGNGNLETLTDPNGHATTYTYDADNEPTKVKEANGTITETGYDGAGKVTSQIDGNKHETKYVRNAIEEVTEVTDPLIHKTTKEYDKAGNLKTLTDPAKRTTTYTYDPGNRLVEVKYSDGKTPTVKYEYDKDGDRTVMTDGTGTSKYTYDQLDRLTETESGHKEKVKYEYDLANEQTKITYPNTKSVTRAYDKAGRLEKVTDWLEHTTKFTYNPDSDRATTVFPTGTSNEDKYAYNNADQMSEVKMLKGAETLASLLYARDNDGQVKTTTSKGLPGEEKPGYEYDTNNRLTKGGATTYEYDAANNTTKIGTGTYKYNKANELETGPSLTYTYDELGERTKTTPTTGSATTYGYDQAGNLISVERPVEGEKAAIKDTYAYDGNGLRASQTISGTTSYLTWEMTEGLPLILNDGTNSYIYGPGGLPVEQITSGGTVTYLHHDQQGSIRLLTGSTGTVTGSTTFDAYGNKTGSTGTSTTPLGYDGQYTSNDTGLIYMRARVYDPTTAQFLSVDPISPISRTPYNYAYDNPLSYYDPTGLCSINPFSSSSCLSEGVEAGVHFAEEHPVATGIALGVIAVGTGGAALAVEAPAGTLALGVTSGAAGLGATSLDASKCFNGDTGACVGAGLGVSSLGLSGPEFLAATNLIKDASAYRALAGAGVVLGSYGALSDLLTEDPNFLEALRC